MILNTGRLKQLRHWHKRIGLVLVLGIFSIASTGLILGWKKHNSSIMPKTQKGSSKKLEQALPLAVLVQLATDTLLHHTSKPLGIERLDLRVQQGAVKCLAEEHWEVQLDLTTGKVLSIGKRHSDWIEQLHDGSLFDQLLGLKNQPFKLLYTTFMALGLLFLGLSGIYVWYKPKALRKEKQNK